jgi:hypothetical protein
VSETGKGNERETERREKVGSKNEIPLDESFGCHNVQD